MPLSQPRDSVAPSDSSVLAESERETLEALARTVVPHAFGNQARGERLIYAIEERVARQSPHKQRLLKRALRWLRSPAAAISVFGFPQSFVRLSAEGRAKRLASWLTSSIAANRSASHAVRRLILLVEYGTEQAHKDIGYRGPYHNRDKAVAWEGAPPGADYGDHPPIAPLAFAPTPTRSLDGNVVKCDAIVIGSGAGGATAAARLAEAGLEVVILEAGALVTGEQLTEREALMLERLYADAGLRTTDDASISLVQGETVGGSSAINWMIMLRTPDWVLDEWTSHHGTEGMRPSEMASVFALVEKELHATKVPDNAHSPNNRIVLDGAHALGWSAYGGSINAHRCVRTGLCGYGCRTGAKQDTTRTYLPRAMEAGAQLIAHARATRIDRVESGTLFPKKRVTVAHTPPDGPARQLTLEAPIVVVAGGAIETPLLLQRSGLGGPAVGKYLRLHPTTGLYARFTDEMYASSGIPLTAVCDEHHQLDSNGYGVWIECPPLHPALTASASPEFGAKHREQMLAFRNLASLIILCRDGAERDRSQGDVRALRDGGRSIRYRLARTDARHLEHGLVAAARILFAAGALEVHSGHSRSVTLSGVKDVDRLRGLPLGPNQVSLFSAHVNGTCRIGADRRIAGCDPNGELFGARGVFVADGSLMPTAPGVNPQETIYALATIVAQRIIARRTRT